MNTKARDSQVNGGLMAVDKSLNITLENQGKTVMHIFLGKNRFAMLLEENAKKSVSYFYPGTYLLPFKEF